MFVAPTSDDGSSRSGLQLSRSVRTVSLRFHNERSLGKPSMHACGSQLRFGLRGSNSHFQVQNLVFYRLNETRMKAMKSRVGLERFELSPRGVKIRCATVTPQTRSGCGRATVRSCRNAESPPRFFLERAPVRVGYDEP